MKQKIWYQAGAIMLLSSLWLGGCSTASTTPEETTSVAESETMEEENVLEEDESLLEEMPEIEETPSVEEKDDTVGTVDQWEEEIYNDEMETLLFFRWDGIVEGIPYQVLSRSIDEQGYATVVVDLSEIDRVMSEEGTERHETICEMVRQMVALFPDREKEGHLFKGYRIQFAKLESALGAELVMSSEDYVQTDWSTFEGTLDSGETMTVYDLTNRE